jgi:gamma-glutamylaminecyclotransferase
MNRIFVYGTLKRGGENHVHLTGQRFVGEAATGPGFTLYGLQGFPGMVRAADAPDGVIGELWEVDADCLRTLDILEGVAEGLYQREAIPLRPPFSDLPVQAYLYRRSLEGRPRVGAVWTV